MQLYRASDALVKHRKSLETHLFERSMNLFGLRPTVTLYDLTNTYFEGEARGQPKARPAVYPVVLSGRNWWCGLRSGTRSKSRA